jgi:sucrose-6-phosphate hydrolase SacC (GH32 family)
LGAPSRNRRDPFLFRAGDGWALLLAEPCDWTNWRQEPASRLRLYRSDDRKRWREAGVIGPWREPGIIWEVPILARIDGHDVLFVSEVDRRTDRGECSVRAWLGTLGEEGFVLARGFPKAGQRID